MKIRFHAGSWAGEPAHQSYRSVSFFFCFSGSFRAVVFASAWYDFSFERTLSFSVGSSSPGCCALYSSRSLQDFSKAVINLLTSLYQAFLTIRSSSIPMLYVLNCSCPFGQNLLRLLLCGWRTSTIIPQEVFSLKLKLTGNTPA